VPWVVWAVVGAAVGAALAPFGRRVVARYAPAPGPAGYVAGSALLMAAAAAGGPSWRTAALCWAAAFAVPLAVIDIRVHRLPDPLTLPCAAGCLGLLAPTPGAPRALLGALVVGGVFGLLALVAPFGWGDAKLGLTLGALLAWRGWAAVFQGVFAGFLLAAAYGLVLLAGRRARGGDPIPFGPFLVLGAALVLGA
jgi:leader peptidase (prepilin peptidase) / N-methyltransferase